ncbi:MAG: hypothetical protein E6H97_10415 [Chloroflexi bacterium]|nr:MAG: hypothetical protein E6H97_10415 [Chloroflexota bacterium]
MAQERSAAPDVEALRRRLRSGTLPAELLKPGHGVVLRAGDRELTRDELRAQAERVAGGLAAVGVKAGERVGLYAATSLDWVIAYLGLQRAGAVLVPMRESRRDHVHIGHYRPPEGRGHRPRRFPRPGPRRGGGMALDVARHPGPRAADVPRARPGHGPARNTPQRRQRHARAVLARRGRRRAH